MKQSKIEETIDESFNRLIDIMIKFPKNPYHINLEEIFFKGKADLIHKLEKIINQKDKQIDLMAEYIAKLDIEIDICTKVENSCFDYAGQNGKLCEECIKQYFEKLAKENKDGN